MPYLIDGHNLIPKIGLRLASPDDEMELVTILQEFARLKRQKVEVYFDGAPIGYDGVRRIGTVRVHFVRMGQTADNTIRARLAGLAKDARNWTVVSSDREVQNSARTARAQYISAEEFVKSIRELFDSAPKGNTADKKVSPAEVEEWLKIFHKNGE
jgi:predicted RNA-binding protein with PIN domain